MYSINYTRRPIHWSALKINIPAWDCHLVCMDSNKNHTHTHTHTHTHQTITDKGIWKAKIPDIGISKRTKIGDI